jgi:hypothetical protein
LLYEGLWVKQKRSKILSNFCFFRGFSNIL